MTTGRHSVLLDFIVGILCIALAFPLFILAHKALPDPPWAYEADRIFIFVIILVLLFLILRLFRILIFIAVLAVIGWLIYGTYYSGYSFNNLYYDYRAMIYGIKEDPNFAGLIFNGDSKFPYQREFKTAVEPNNPIVRQFAVAAVNENFKTEQQQYEKHRTMIQSFAIFKKINNNWNYISDPQSREYFARASESARSLAGDCDDHSILMAAAIESIGGKTRLVHTTGHIYPELFIGDKNDLEQMNYLIKQILFEVESSGQSIFYHEDDKGNVWLNLDYTAKYPGGPFFKEEILGVMNL